jgi:serine protease inhibitor
MKNERFICKIYQIFFQFMNIKSLFYIIFIAFLFCECSKKSDDYDYGMSITIPKIVGTPAGEFSNEELNLCKASNAFQIKILEQFFKQNPNQNIALSSLYLFANLANDTLFDSYFKLLYENFNITDYSTENISQKYDSIRSIIRKIDSSLHLQSSFDTLQKQSLTISQSTDFLLLYDDAVQLQKADYDNQKEVFSLSNEFKVYESEEETVAEVPLGNANYSLVMIKPKGDLTAYIENFTELQYMNLIDSLRTQNVNIVFPKLQFTTANLNLTFPIFENMTGIEDIIALKLNCRVTGISPTYAMLKTRECNDDKHLTKSTITDRITFDRDFIFLLRGRYSNIILLLGVFID